MPTCKDFETELVNEFNEARKMELSEIAINAGILHKKVGGYPGSNHRMPICCQVMRQQMKSGDTVIKQPPKGNGASLVIRYHL